MFRCVCPVCPLALYASCVSPDEQRLAEARQEGQQQGMQQGIQTERRITIENLLRVRFGTLDEELVAIIEPMLVLPPEEFTRFLLQSSREELLARFRQT
ncbi:MAG: hypothetical protein KME38_03955 [Spirirestis rafaelensis WJT71-NPBG6]|jgi:hypothetical protein|nr:hypothetical protein [Spirirestis rafaelensis WJT71-NPBG6]